jgi:hypothetical protein
MQFFLAKSASISLKAGTRNLMSPSTVSAIALNAQMMRIVLHIEYADSLELNGIQLAVA